MRDRGFPRLALVPPCLAQTCGTALVSRIAVAKELVVPSSVALLLGLVVGCNASRADDDFRSLPKGSDAGRVTMPTADGGSPLDEPDELQGFGGPKGPYFEEVDVGYDALLESFDNYWRFFCVCESGQSTGSDFDACVDGYVDPYPPPLLACTKTVLSRSAAALESLNCELENAETYIACIEESTCIDFSHITECETDRIISGFDCKDVPYDVWAEDQTLCYGQEVPSAFECADGETIDPDFACDFAEDCADGSDETDCPDPHAGLDL